MLILRSASVKHPASRGSVKLTRGRAREALQKSYPSFWASHSGQTGLGSARIIYFGKAKVKIEPSVRKSIWRL